LKGASRFPFFNDHRREKEKGAPLGSSKGKKDETVWFMKVRGQKRKRLREKKKRKRRGIEKGTTCPPVRIGCLSTFAVPPGPFYYRRET